MFSWLHSSGFGPARPRLRPSLPPFPGTVPGVQAEGGRRRAEGALGYDIALSQKAELFLVGGAGVAICVPEGMESETDFALNYGLGGRYFLSPRLALRGDVRMHHVLDAMADTRERILVDPVREDLFALELSIGVSYFIGRR